MCAVEEGPPAAAQKDVHVIDVADQEVAAIDVLAETAMSVAGPVAGPRSSGIDDEFWPHATTIAQQLPRSLRAGLNRFRLAEREPLCLIRGYSLADEALGPTPDHWSRPAVSPLARRLDMIFALCSCLLGDPIGWGSQQDASIIQNIIPIRGDDWRQISSASRSALTLHTEDAFHPHRGDYVALMCLRNPSGVPTLYSCIDDVRLPAATVQVLLQPRFLFRRDDSHTPRAAPDGGQKAAVLFGAPDSPYLRLDAYFMDEMPDDPVATASLTALEAALAENVRGIVLAPGDILFIDNYRVVHGRAPFTARYDGADRWLKRINIARDLRRSRDVRRSPTGRIIRGEQEPRSAPAADLVVGPDQGGCG